MAMNNSLREIGLDIKNLSSDQLAEWAASGGKVVPNLRGELNVHRDNSSERVRRILLWTHTKRRTVKVRTYKERACALLDLDLLLANNVASSVAHKAIINSYGLSNKSVLSTWKKRKDFILMRAVEVGGALVRKHRARRARWEEAEEVLYQRFLFRRKCLRKGVSGTWLKVQMSEILGQYFGMQRSKVLSNGWLHKFQRRYGITSQCRTNKHKQSVQTRLPVIRQCHQYIRHIQSQDPAQQSSAKYGRFSLKQMWSMDQSPLSFSAGTSRSLNPVGEPCAVMEKDSDKRFCSLQIAICADAKEMVNTKIDIIFNGQGLRISAAERAHYDALRNVRVRWQENSWADGVIMMQWYLDFREDTLHLGEVMLVLDNHGAQKTEACRRFMDAMDIIPVYIPPYCTDCISPVDCNVAVRIKQRVKVLFRAYEASQSDHWADTITASEKRMLVAQWVSQAWSDFLREEGYIIEQSFVKTGVALAMDGSEDHLVKLEGRASQLYTVATPAGPEGDFMFH